MGTTSIATYDSFAHYSLTEEGRAGACEHSIAPECTGLRVPSEKLDAGACRYSRLYSALSEVPLVVCENAARSLRAAMIRGAL